jgi:hypothetical protein
MSLLLSKYVMMLKQLKTICALMASGCRLLHSFSLAPTQFSGLPHATLNAIGSRENSPSTKGNQQSGNRIRAPFEIVLVRCDRLVALRQIVARLVGVLVLIVRQKGDSHDFFCGGLRTPLWGESVAGFM